MYVCTPINTVAAPAGCSCVSKHQSTKLDTYIHDSGRMFVHSLMCTHWVNADESAVR